MTDLPVPVPTPGEDLLARYGEHMMNTFGHPKRAFVRGQGVHLWDADGRRYLDLLAGIAVNSLGHAHPAVLAALVDQAATLGHVSNFFATPTQVRLGERLAELATLNAPATPARVFLTNSGTEANEAAFKLTRRTGRRRIVAMEGAFHGRTMGALALTHNPAYREPFEPLPGEVTFVPYGDEAALAAVVDESVAAVVIEPLQGENGVAVPPTGYLEAARALTRRAGALLWLDEVQTGMGRCGHWLAHEPTGITADIVTLAKGLGAGFPVGACIGIGPAADLLGPGSHGSTFGGNPLAARLALTVIEVIERDSLLDHVRILGEQIAAGIEGPGYRGIDHVRGEGLLRGIVLTEPIAPAFAEAALEAGFVVNAPRPHVIRLAPPLVATWADVEPFVEAVPALLDTARRAGGRP